jgi:eukaryotic-like serine/threonine-protein kinase
MEATQVLGGRYELGDPLGAGGMAVVWRARDRVLDRTVAVKVLAGRHATDPRSRQRIHDEARAAAALSHPNIAQVYDFGVSEGAGSPTPYVVMELVRGETLQQRLAGGPLPPAYGMRVCAEVAAALAAAHADGLVHRDIKPANVMVTATGVKVVDFGIAAAVAPGGAGEEEVEIFGTPEYVAPERLVDDAVQPAADVYALGVLLYRLLSGRSPWTADTTTQILAAHVHIQPAPLEAGPGVPDYIAALCRRCLSKDPTLRPSARDAAAVLAHGAGLRVVTDEPDPRPAAAAVDATPSVLIRPLGADQTTRAAVVPAQRAPVPAETWPAAPAGSPSAPEASAPRPARAPRRARGRLIGAAGAVVAAALLWLVVPGDRHGPPAAEATVTDPAPSAPAGAAGRPHDSSTGDAGAPAADTVTAGAPRRTSGGSARTPTPGPGGVPGAGPGDTPTGTPPGTGPTRATPTPTATTPDAPPQERTFSSDGGSVRATCPSPGTAQLLSWTPARSYRVDELSPGPAAAAAVVFRHGNQRIRMTVTCSGGVPATSNDRV